MKNTIIFLLVCFAITLTVNLSSERTITSKFIVDSVTGTVEKITYPNRGDYPTVYHLKEYPEAYFQSYASDSYLEQAEIETGEDPWEIGSICTISYLKTDTKPNDSNDGYNEYYDLITLRKNGTALIDKELYLSCERRDIYRGKILAAVLAFLALTTFLSVYYAKRVQKSAQKKIAKLLSFENGKGTWNQHSLFVELDRKKTIGKNFLDKELSVMISTKIPTNTKKRIGKSLPFQIYQKNNARMACLFKRSVTYSFNQKKFINKLSEAIAKYETALEKYT
ncbi:MAG: hypothetical protein ACI81T_003068 [Bacteroidia bacterium]|jgi:hypothetical protein